MSPIVAFVFYHCHIFWIKKCPFKVVKEYLYQQEKTDGMNCCPEKTNSAAKLLETRVLTYAHVITAGAEVGGPKSGTCHRHGWGLVNDDSGRSMMVDGCPRHRSIWGCRRVISRWRIIKVWLNYWCGLKESEGRLRNITVPTQYLSTIRPT